MTDYLVDLAKPRTDNPTGLQLSPTAQLPAVVPDAKGRIDAAVAAVKRAEDAFHKATSCDVLLEKTRVRGWVAQHSWSTSVLGFGAIAAGIGGGIGGLGYDWQLLWLLPAAAVGFFASLAIEDSIDKLRRMAGARTLDSKEVEPIVTALEGASRDDRALMRLFVEQQATDLEDAKRLTPKAAHALREAINDSVGNADELARVGFVVTFAKNSAKGSPELSTLTALLTQLRTATPQERIAAGEYLEARLYPNERPLANLGTDFARNLFAIVAKARKGEVDGGPAEIAA